MANTIGIQQQASVTYKGQTGSAQNMAPVLKQEMSMGQALANGQTRGPGQTRDFVNVAIFNDGQGRQTQGSPETIFNIIQQQQSNYVEAQPPQEKKEKSGGIGDVAKKLLDPAGIVDKGKKLLGGL